MNQQWVAWLFLIIAGVFEVLWAVGLKYSDSFTKFWPSVVTVVAMALSVLFLGRAVKVLPIGTAYAIWTGIGAVGVAIVGMIVFGESRAVIRLVCIGLIVVGVLGLKLFGTHG